MLQPTEAQATPQIMNPPISAFGACLTVLPSNHPGVVQPQATLPNKYTLALPLG